MAGSDRRFDRSPIILEHASARGKVLRNADNYTRGSQLIGHQFSMFRAGLRPPILIWLGAFVVIYWVMLSAIMGEHEVQLCSWRLGSTLWTWMSFDKFKPMNIVLSNGTVHRTAMGYIPYIPDVQLAWAKAIKAILGSLASATLISIPAISWFVNFALNRGSSVLQERHERGATLVEKHVLVSDVMEHNEREFTKAAARLFPGVDPDAVKALPFADRKAGGLHHPYTLADIPYPYNLEASHTIVIGTTGSGKTTQLRQLVAGMRRRQDSAVIFDLTGAFVEAFYDPETDVILNPGDARCPTWSLFADCTTEAEFTAASHAIVPNDGGSSDPFWVVAEQGQPGERYHAVAEERFAVRDIAEVIGAALGIPTKSISPEGAQQDFGWFGLFAELNLEASSAWTRARFGWHPSGPGLIADLQAMKYSGL